jgi:hypothetical protein
LQDYIHKVPVILHESLQRESHKPDSNRVITAAMQADHNWHLHRSNCRNTLNYKHTASGTLLTCNIGLVSLTLPAPKAGEFLGLILLFLKLPRHRGNYRHIVLTLRHYLCVWYYRAKNNDCFHITNKPGLFNEDTVFVRNEVSRYSLCR